MIHLDRLHDAIVRLTGSPFAGVVVRDVITGPRRPTYRFIEIVCRGREYSSPRDAASIRREIKRLKRDHGWKSRPTSESSSRCSRPDCGSNGSPAGDRPLAEREAGSRART